MIGTKIVVTPDFNTSLAKECLMASYTLLSKLIEPGDELTIIDGKFEIIPFYGKCFGVKRIMVNKLNKVIDVKNAEDRWALFTEFHIKGTDKCIETFFILVE